MNLKALNNSDWKLKIQYELHITRKDEKSQALHNTAETVTVIRLGLLEDAFDPGESEVV